jgi:SAM-dependent methyltransferase
MPFDGGAEAYDRFMGLWSRPLAAEMVHLLEPDQGRRALDVGCGPGSLTGALVSRLGVGGVAAVDPAPQFVEAVRERFPGVEVQRAKAESLPFADDSFDLCLAQLVVHFMKDPVAGLREMGRVVRPGGVVAASVWDHGTGPGPLTAFWAAVRRLDPSSRGEADLAGTHDGELVDLARQARLGGAEQHVLTVHRRYESFEDWWEPFTFGIGPAGEIVASLDDAGRERLREACRRELPSDGPFELPARAWCVVASPR